MWNPDDKNTDIVVVESKYISPRNLPLIVKQSMESARFVITVEFYTKWYELFVVDTETDEITTLRNWCEQYKCDRELFEKLIDIDGNGINLTWVDHCVNPLAILEFAKQNPECTVDEYAFELIVGRWSIEILELRNITHR